MNKLFICVLLLATPPVYTAQYGCVGECANGTGTYYFPSGNRYEGEWKDKKKNGQGTYYLSNGERQYEGEWKDDKKDGRGTLFIANGERYEGEWKDGKQNGTGTYYYANGDRYDGGWKDGKQNGTGTYYYANGDHYKGEWVDGEREVVLFSPGAIIVVAVAVAFFPIFYGIRRWYESKRSEALRSVALSLGMSCEDGRNIDATQRFGSFQLFSQGSDKKVRNCMSGTIDGIDVTTFGYEYTVVGDDVSATLRQTVVVFRSNELSLPNFELRPRERSDKVLFGERFDKLVFGERKDIDFHSHPDFSESYFLTGNDESAIRHVFSRSVLGYFEIYKFWSVEGRDDLLLLCYRHGARLRPDEIKFFLDKGRAVFDLFRKKP